MALKKKKKKKNAQRVNKPCSSSITLEHSCLLRGFVSVQIQFIVLKPARYNVPFLLAELKKPCNETISVRCHVPF